MTIVYYLQVDRQSERTNQTFELTIRHHVCEHLDGSWMDLLPFLQWNLNNVYIRFIGMSPYEYLFGFKLESPIDRLTTAFRTPEDILERKFIKEYLQKDV